MYINAIWLDSEQQTEVVSKSYSTGITEKTYNFGVTYHTDSALESRKGYRKHYANYTKNQVGGNSSSLAFMKMKLFQTTKNLIK